MWITREFRITNNPNGRVNAYVTGFGEDASHEALCPDQHEERSGPGNMTGEVWNL